MDDGLSENVRFVRQNAMWVCRSCYRPGGFACAQNTTFGQCVNCGITFMHHNGYAPRYCKSCCTETIDDVTKPVRCQRCFNY
jgi:hypothetical protein